MATAQETYRRRLARMETLVKEARALSGPLIKELNALDEGDPKRESVMQRLRGLAAPIQDLQQANKSNPIDLGTVQGLDPLDAAASTFLTKYSADIGYEGGVAGVGSIGKEWQVGTPEYGVREGKETATAYAEERSEAGLALADEALQEGLDVIGQAAEDVKTEYDVGQEEAATAIAAGKEESLEYIAAGEEAIEDAAATGKEEIAAAGEVTGQELAAIGQQTGQEIADAALSGRDEMVSAYEEGLDYAKGQLSPYAEAGTGALGAYETALGLGDQPFDMATLENLPGYQFRLEQGLDAVKTSAAARGGSFGGRALKELQVRGEGLASQEFGRYLGGLSDMSRMGLGASSTLASMGTQTAAGIAGAQQFGATGVMTGAEVKGQYASIGAQVKGQAAQTGAQFGATGQMAAAQFGAAGKTAISQQATVQAVSAITTGTMGRAGATQAAAGASASIYAQEASMVASAYGATAAIGANATMSAAIQNSQTAMARMEAQLARDLAAMQENSSGWMDFLEIAAPILGGVAAGPGGAAAVDYLIGD